VKRKNVLVLGLALAAGLAIYLMAVTPVDTTIAMMYATGWTAGAIQPVNFDPYAAATHPARLNPGNVLGMFDATQDPPVPGEPYNPNEKFFGLAARTWTNYTFDEPFCNVDYAPDIEFAEVTWGSWHPEAALVYLTDAYVRDAGGNLIAYGASDDGIGYLAGIVWNKVGINGVTAARRLEITQSYFAGVRDFAENTYRQEGNFGLSEFRLPGEVVNATGITLVDITNVVYSEYNPATYLNIGGLNNGYLVILLGLDPLSVSAVYGTDGNTDGYDLDAIRVYKCAPCIEDDSATGMGTRIKLKGTWFMYNYYRDSGTECYPIQAGNPKNGINTIGQYCIVDNGNGTYTAEYTINPTITINGWIYDIVVVEEHLAISPAMSFTAVPGQDDNADFFVPFDEFISLSRGFYVFAHFEVEYR